VVTRQPQVERRTAKVRLSKTDVLPLYHATNCDGTLAVDGWAVTFGTVRRGLGGLGPRPLFAVPNVTAHPSAASVPTSYYSTGTTFASKLWPINDILRPKLRLHVDIKKERKGAYSSS